jgi:long-chain acyl-CoA synthetase
MTRVASTVCDLLLHQANHQADRPCLNAYDDGRWKRWTWRELTHTVVSAAATLHRAGVQPGDRIILWSENRWEWLIADLAIQWAGGVGVPLHASLTANQVMSLAEHCDAKLALVSDRASVQQLKRVESAAGQGLQFLMLGTEAEATDNDPRLLPVETDGRSSREVLSAGPAVVDVDALTTILYTSGTTGVPKGVMLSQRNLVSNIHSILEGLPLFPEDVRLGFLPLSHIFARTCDLYTWIAAGCQFVLARSTASVAEDLQRWSPTYLNGVPYFYEKFLRLAEAEAKEAEPGWLQKQLGGRIRLCNCGGAPLPDRVQQWYDSQGVTLITGYGLTETSPVLTSSVPGKMKMGAVGCAVQNVRIKLAKDGEVLAQGPNVMMGYFRDEAGTQAVFEGDWFRTGDTGELDDEGYLRLTGRKKELIITTGGKNIDPFAIEQRLMVAPEIQQCMVVGDGRDFLAALILPRSDLDHAQAVDWLTLARQYLSEVSHYEQVGCVVLMEEPFSLTKGQVTVKGSLRRQKIERDYRSEIDAAYQLAKRGQRRDGKPS